MKRLTFNFLVLFVIGLCDFFPFVAKASDCSIERMDLLKKFAQEQRTETPALAKELLKCPELKNEVIVWKTLYESFTDQLQTARPALQAKSGQPLIGPNQVNSDEDLEKNMQAKNPNWQEDAEANLAMARAYVKTNRYSKAKETYERYMKLKPDDFDVRSEMGSEFQEFDPAYALQNFNLLTYIFLSRLMQKILSMWVQ